MKVGKRGKVMMMTALFRIVQLEIIIIIKTSSENHLGIIFLVQSEHFPHFLSVSLSLLLLLLSLLLL